MPRYLQAALALTAILSTCALGAQAQTADNLQNSALPPHAVWLDSLDLSHVQQGYGTAQADKSVNGNPLTLGGAVYAHGVGTHADSLMKIDLHGAATHFDSMVGVDGDAGGAGVVKFEVDVDGKAAATTGLIHDGDKPQEVSVDLTGAKTMTLRVIAGGNGIDYDHADWVGARITLVSDSSPKPESVGVMTAPPRIVLLPADPHPAIHGPRIVGATPGYPFLFLIPATGDGPLVYSAKGLPGGLTLDSATGIISGSLKNDGTTVVHVSVHGPKGSAARDLTIVGGDHKLALTPPMGWNSWNVWAGKVDEGKVKAAADEMISTGLAGHGFQYINIDDTWEAGRDAQGRIQSNEKFPDMAGLTAYIHAKGLKTGIYSSPGPKTCAGFTASYQHEDQDAQSYADWGFDYLKYDWCSYGGIAKDHSLPELQKPYAVMRASLDKVHRDILFSFCQYGMGAVWKWGAQIGGNCWRTHGDINDNWGSLHDIFEKENGHEIYAGPGHWNDPDMLEVGIVGFGNTHPTRLTPNEQILHISMWCLFSAPLLIGCDMTRLDPFTLALLSNDEVLDIDQDTLGKPAGRISQDPSGAEVWARPLADGAKAVALVNTAEDPQTVTVNWSDIGVKGAQPVRDLWLHKNVGTVSDRYSVEVPAHGVVLVKIGKARG